MKFSRHLAFAWANPITLLLLLSLASCQSAGKLVVAAGSTSESLVFVLSDWSEQKPGKLSSVDVYRCADRGDGLPETGELVWAASVKEGLEPPLVGIFSYGKNFGNLVTSEGPAQLSAGCYVARAYAAFPDPRSAVTQFRVEKDGSAVGVYRK